ncbi:MAG: OmpA family protein [Gammaproteobacteria bacterium]|nr:OmpA family protein [Gammaproteobacteria bacterium]NNF61347.1 OmpA family protein [Gammaproteobacteria bacterium]
MNRCMVLATVLLSFLTLQSASATDWIVPEGQWYFSPMVGMNWEDKDRAADPGVAVSLGLGRQIAEAWALEFSAFGGQHDGFNEQNMMGIGVDFLRSLNTSGLVTPYVLLGTGWIRDDIVEHPSVAGELDYDNFMGSVGLGLVAPLGDAASRFRAEVRYRLDLHDPSSFGDLLTTIGFYMPLGEAPARTPKTLPDADGDGVADDVDLCPATTAGSSVDQYGCELDSDNDGVANSKDRCPDTARGTKVDARGCPPAADNDGDGVTDDMDKCPGTPRSVKVGADGCEVDSDGDSVVDSLDSCPNTTMGVRIDVRGCEIRDKIDLPGVQFELSSAKLVDESTAILKEAAETLRRNPDLRVEAAGHTDTSGPAEFNRDLSQRRAESVRRYLISRGVNADNITAKGYGESEPVADNSTRPGRIRNRRVELRILN